MRSILATLMVLCTLCVPAQAGGFQDKETPLKVKSKPAASARGCGGSGKTVLKVTFDRTGKVTEVLPLKSSGCQPFDDSATRSARQIVFEPATKNGSPVTVTRPVEYSYSVY